MFLFLEVTVNRKSLPQQLALFEPQLPTWESLPTDRQQALSEILSLLLEKLLLQQTGQTIYDPPNHDVER
jgi:hypothetical protein